MIKLMVSKVIARLADPAADFVVVRPFSPLFSPVLCYRTKTLCIFSLIAKMRDHSKNLAMFSQFWSSAQRKYVSKPMSKGGVSLPSLSRRLTTEMSKSLHP